MRALIVALVATVTVAAQQPPPTFRSGADVVQVDVVVQDKSGQFVSDLKADDFEIREDGKSQPVEILYVSGAPGTAVPGTLPRSAPGTEAPGTRAPGTKAPARVFIAVFDDDHLSPGGFKRVQAAALDLFSKEFQQGDIGGVVERGQMANKRLTSDREELLTAVRNAKPNSRSNSRLFEERQWPRMTTLEAVQYVVNEGGRSGGNPQGSMTFQAMLTRACTDEPDACQKGRLDIESMIQEKARRMAEEAQVATNATLATLGAVMNGLSRMEGRKTILLLSEGFIAEESWASVQQAVAAAAISHARIYALDARGLDSRGMGERLAGSDPGNDSTARLLAAMDYGADSINSLAVDTGGFVVRNTNIFDRAVAQIARDASTYYVLGYRPATPQDGKFHRIEVKVKRPGVTVRARRGYVATAKPVAVETAKAPESAAPDTAGLKPGSTTEETAGLKSATTTALSTTTVAPLTTADMPSETPALRLRPDASKHVDTLAANLPPDRNATAGWEAYQRGDVESARTSLAVAAASPGARPWVFYALGQAQYALGDFSAAIESWEQVRQRTPDFEPVYFDLADGYMQTREYDKAIQVLRAARSRWDKDAEVLEAMGVIQVKRGALDDAVKSFEEAIALTPQDAVGYYNLAKTFELRWLKSRRYVEITRTWTSNESDRKNAVARYEQYLKIGGPLEASAREGLQRLSWGLK